MKSISFGISGASGMPIAFALLKQILLSNYQVHLVISNAAIMTIKQESGFTLSSNPNTSKEVLVNELAISNSDNLFVYNNNDWYAPIASGSSVCEAMVVCPCSMASLGKIANGIGDDLLSRACDVILKERKNLVLVPRETPLSAIHLKNMYDLACLGVSIIPPVPAFYTRPQTIEDIINFIVSRIMDQLGIINELSPRWSKPTQ